MSPGEAIKLNVVAFDQNGRELKEVDISWQALDPRAGSISRSGVFRASFTKDTFSNVLVVTAQPPSGSKLGGAVQATASVTVQEFTGRQEPTGIRVFPQAPELAPREALFLTALAVDANGVAIPDIKFRWEMLKPSAGSISQGNRLTASANVGTYPDAVRVSLVPRGEGLGATISTLLDVQVLDPGSAAHRYSGTVLPQVRSLRPKEHMRFTALIIDRRGNLISPIDPQWEVLDPRAGAISRQGLFTAGEEPSIYRDAIRVSMGIGGVEDRVVAKATVAIVDLSASLGAGARETLPSVAIFPEQVVLSPGESAQGHHCQLEGRPPQLVSGQRQLVPRPTRGG